MSTSSMVYTISGSTLPPSLRPMVMVTEARLVASQHFWFSSGVALSRYLVMWKSWWMGRPLVRSVLVMSPVTCWLTPWL